MHETGAITGYIDVAQVTLYVFWAFFAGLIFYLRREDKREGYPLDNDRSDLVTVQGFPSIPRPKLFRLDHGGTQQSPRPEAPPAVAALPYAAFPGAPLVPTGDPMLDGVGPAAYAQRSEVPDQSPEGLPKLVPLRVAEGWFISPDDINPIGMEVVGADGVAAGRVVDAWVDRSETVVRHLEVEVAAEAGLRRILLPMTFVRLNERLGQVRVASIMGSQFAAVPGTARPDQVTPREEDRIQAYYGSGHLYATPQRLGPVL